MLKLQGTLPRGLSSLPSGAVCLKAHYPRGSSACLNLYFGQVVGCIYAPSVEKVHECTLHDDYGIIFSQRKSANCMGAAVR